MQNQDLETIEAAEIAVTGPVGKPAKLKRAIAAGRPDLRVTLISVATLGAALAAAGICWWIAALLLDDQTVMPGPPSVATRFSELISSDGRNALPANAWASLARIVVGWGGGVLLGIAVGVAMASNRLVQGLLDPLIEIIRPIPPLAFAPLLVIWFGIGELPKYLILGFVAFPVVAISTVASIRGIDGTWTRAAQTLGANKRYILRRVTIPAALPGILISIRLASGLCWGTLVAAEIIASTSGLGWLIVQAGRYLDTPTIFVGIITIGALAFITDRILRWAENRLVPWRGKAAT